MRTVFVLAVAAMAMLVAPSGVASRTRAAMPAPVFTADQAQAGARLYAIRCAMCHGAQLAGTLEIPGLKGKFIAGWSGRPVGDLYDYLSRAMPQPAPGSLSGEDNAKLLAFLLRENGLAPGGRPLPADRAALARMVFNPVTAR